MNISGYQDDILKLQVSGCDHEDHDHWMRAEKTFDRTEEEQQRQPRKVLHMPKAISDVLNIGWTHLTVGPLHIKHWGAHPPPPHDRRLWFMA